jgi:chromosome segregation protein
MGATSAKSLRGGGMDDVIFAGTDSRASRERAEVKLSIDNEDRRAPARFNDSETLEVVRRITRGKGSDYKINGEDVRAKDVQLLFADAGTGANSPALVRQGQISELINAKPENRRLVLEEAAGVAGLRARRREAQLRLNAAEANLERLLEVVGSLDERLSVLNRQAKQASRYRELSQQIRSFESLLWLRRWVEAGDVLQAAEVELKTADEIAESALIAAAMATRKHESAQSKIQPLRDAEAEAAAAFRHAERVRDQLDRELNETQSRIEQLTAQIDELSKTRERESELHEEANDTLERLNSNLEQLKAQSEDDESRLEEASAKFEAADQLRSEAEQSLDHASSEAAEIRARRVSAQRDLGAAKSRADRLRQEAHEAKTAQNAIDDDPLPNLSALEAAVGSAHSQLSSAQEKVEQCEAVHTQTRNDAAQAREHALSVEGDAQALSREKSSLERMLESSETENQALDSVSARPGYEIALAAAFGEDLEASLNADAARYWQGSEAFSGELPAGAQALAEFVDAPKALSARLLSIGVVDDRELEALTPELKPGQRLVSRSGAVRRWDGYHVEAGAKLPSAVRLETRNRLNEVLSLLETAGREASRKRQEATEANANVNQSDADLRSARDSLRESENALRQCDSEYNDSKALVAKIETRKSGLTDAFDRAQARLSEALLELEQAKSQLDSAVSVSDGSEAIESARKNAEAHRQAAADARSEVESVRRDAQGRRHRLASIEREVQDWSRREANAKQRLDELSRRLEYSKEQLEAAMAKPAQLEAKRPDLLEALESAELKAREARERVVEAELGQRDIDSELRSREKAAAEAREARAGAHARVTAARERVEETTRRLTEATGESPQTLAERAKNSEFQSSPSDELERRLDSSRASRERLGAVNLRADEESRELEAERKRLSEECNDLEQAVARLRKAVDTLSKEGRARLLDAFETVDRHFQTLFATLFNGGYAKLELTDNEDPLEAGLEIYACPPGKKLETMSLMSGGEQALTATALIFAVFLVNPAPVCVLDEVDAPLDDANVDRYCTMLARMREMTQTRFLVITHNAVTMSRMDRLFGVTMGERGVSQLVSVNLSAAEQMLAAE